MKKKEELEEKAKKKQKNKKIEIDNHEDEDNTKTIYVERNSGFNTFEVIIIIVISVLFGILVGYFLSNSRSTVKAREASSELRDLIVTYNNIVDNYYGDVDEKKLVNAAINGMISSLEDPYSLYLDSDFTDDFNTTVDGYYIGLGITIMTRDDANEIISVDKKGDAYKKLKKGDIIVKVNDKDVTTKGAADIVELVKDSKETVSVTVRRSGIDKTYKIKKRKIEIDSVTSEVLDNNIGYIRIDNIASNTFKQFNNNLEKLEKEEIDSLIIDVRSNPGGHLKQTGQILDLFFKKNTVLYQVKTKNRTTKVKATSKRERSYPIVVLTDFDSASASEILASCFQERYKRATIVGETTYGKGTVQNVVDLKNGSAVKYTTETWLTSKGNIINGIGVKPDVVVNRNEEYIANPTKENDNQLAKAIEILIEKKESN